jgi:uncharacterized membrane protein
VTLVLRGFFLTSAVMLALLALAAPTIEVGSGTFVIAVISAAMLGVVFLGSAACLYADWDPFEELLG